MSRFPVVDESMRNVATRQLAAIDELADLATQHLDAAAPDELWRFALNARVTAANLATALDHHEPIPERAHQETMRGLKVAQEVEKVRRMQAERRTADAVDAEVRRRAETFDPGRVQVNDRQGGFL